MLLDGRLAAVIAREGADTIAQKINFASHDLKIGLCQNLYLGQEFSVVARCDLSEATGGV